MIPAGQKPWGGGETGASPKVPETEVGKRVGCLDPYRAGKQAGAGGGAADRTALTTIRHDIEAAGRDR
jgi:hypothetical protein